jgi:hypothetical protein
MLFSELPHLALLMRADFQVRARFPGARQNESGFSVFGEIGERVGLVHSPGLSNFAARVRQYP